MSQTDSLEEKVTQPALDAQIETLALRLSLGADELTGALQQLEAASPISRRIGLQLLELLNLDTASWKFVPQTQLLLFVLQRAVNIEEPQPELLRLCEVLEQNYPEYFGQEFWHA